jgi:hypothetical protein
VCRATPVPFSVALRLPPERRTALRKGPGVRICPLDSTPAESKGVPFTRHVVAFVGMCSLTVVGRCGAQTAAVAGDPLAAVKDLDCCGGNTRLDLMARQLVRHTVVMLGDLDVVVEADPAALPLGILVRERRQRPERRLVQLLKKRPPARPQPRIGRSFSSSSRARTAALRVRPARRSADAVTVPGSSARRPGPDFPSLRWGRLLALSRGL